MAKEDLIEVTGLIDEILPASMFKVTLDDLNTTIVCYLGGKLKKNRIKIIRGDRVRVELSPYDLTKGRINYRL